MAVPSSTTATMWFLALVAVLSSASGAQAQFNITNLCNTTIAIANAARNYSVKSGTTTTLLESPAAFFTGPLNISVVPTPATNTSAVTVPVPTQIVSFLSSLFGLNTIIIARNRSCVSLTVTFTVISQFSLPLGSICPPRGRPNLIMNLSKLTGGYRTTVSKLRSLYSGAERTAEKWLPTRTAASGI